MQDVLWLKAVVKGLVLPPGGPLLLAIAGLAFARRRPRLGRSLAAIGVVSLALLSLPIVAGMLDATMGARVAFDAAKPTGAQAIVILGGGVRRDAAEYGGDTLGRLTLDRVRYGARVARETRLPVLVTGGSVGGSVPEAFVMRDALAREYGVDVRWVEAGARNTRENAQRTAELLARDGIRRVVLVAHTFDMRRAIAEFEAAGLDPVPAPTGVTSARRPLEIADFVPSVFALEANYFVLYETLAYAVFVATR